MHAADSHSASAAFLGLPPALCARERAAAWVLPVPYEATVSYGAGTRGGPAAILAASAQVEWFVHELEGEPAAQYGIHTLPPPAPLDGPPETALAAVEAAVVSALGSRPAPRVLAVLGGEHALSGAVARGIVRAGLHDLVAVHVDAHADLRARFDGTPLSHACAARRILDVAPVFQVGIRSLSAEEDAFRRTCPRVTTVFAEEALASRAYLDALAAFVRGRTVYLTIDLDGLDPAVMPAVGTPEPGGLRWEDLLALVRTVCRHAARVPVFDVVELAPLPGLIAPEYAAAKLVYTVMALALAGAGRSAQ
jgi:agmatinase